ncbi:hypothetical protein J6590_007758 [Homalodisca vitripennis]|nr:hypothetical protein J6590_007758 [Homalodisca vitripennis]
MAVNLIHQAALKIVHVIYLIVFGHAKAERAGGSLRLLTSCNAAVLLEVSAIDRVGNCPPRPPHTPAPPAPYQPPLTTSLTQFICLLFPCSS